MTIGEKSAYLKGLADGMELDTTKAEVRLISELIGLVSEIASAVEVIDDETCTLTDYVDELDHDLGELEEYVYECDDDDDEFFDDDDDECEYGEYDDDECDGECEGCSGCGDDDGDVFDATAEGMRCVMCDNCGDTICYDETLDVADIICPACNKPVVSPSEEDQ